MMKTRRLLISVVFSPFLLAACATVQPPEAEEALAEVFPSTTEIPAEFQIDDVDSGEVDDGWIATFGDAQLDSLVDEAINNNLNLQAAASQVDRAAGLARLAGASLRPMVGLGGGGSETFTDMDLLSGNSYNAALSMSWEMDVWGKLRQRAAAGEAALAATTADYAFARQSIAAPTAKTWFLATEIEQQLRLAEESVDIFREVLDIVTVKERVGQVTMQDVYLTGADLSSAEESVQQATAARDSILRGLEVLLGRYPGADIETAAEQLPLPLAIPVGVPSDLIARRPDLQAAESRVRAAFFLTEEARLARLPSFDLGVSAGYTSLTDFIGSLSAGVVAPLYTGGALEGQLEIATADQMAAVAVYGQAVLMSFMEVENALANERIFTQRLALLERVVEDNQRAYDLAVTQYNVGRIEVLNVLQIQGRVLASRSALIRIQNERLATRIDLHLALGGSFEVAEGQ
jgi:NodT family efflux transporter outer membrane factor (OMF) lipoprotein